jgi:hypothetical protein
VIVENIDGDPLVPAVLGSKPGDPAPPAPTVIGVDVLPVIEIFVPPGKDVLYPPAPPPPPEPPPPPATTK